MQIVIIFLVFVLFCTFLVMYRNLHFNAILDIADVCGNGTIAIVGNGELHADNHQEINGCGCVIRFNDMKNKRKEDRMDVLVLRHNAIDSIDHNMKSSVILWPVYKYCSEGTIERMKMNSNIITPIPVFEESCIKDKEQWRSKIIFEKCHKSTKQGDARCGPSSGAAVIDHLLSHPKINPNNIHIFGMNWNGGDWHIDFKDPFLVQECCKGCKIHTTSTNNYAN